MKNIDEKSKIKQNGFLVPVFAFVLFLFALLALGVTTRRTVWADEPLFSLQINAEFAAEVQEPIPVKLYQIARQDVYGKLTIMPQYQSQSIDLSTLSPEYWENTAKTLDSYILQQKIQPEHTAQIDQSGKALIGSAEQGVEAGIYLLKADAAANERASYRPLTSVVSVPLREARKEGGRTILEVNLKYEKTDNTKQTLTVYKTWDDNDNPKRPDFVRVVLYENEQAREEVVLSKANQWTHTWRNLAADSQWTVVEKAVPAGYTFSLEQKNSVLTLRNHMPNQPRSNVPRGKLPVTGFLEWPIPLLFAVGLLFIGIGFWKKNRQRK